MNHKFTVKRQVTLSHEDDLGLFLIECNMLETKSEALRLAKVFFGSHVRLEVFENNQEELCFEVHDKGPIVRPSSSLLGTVYVS